MSTLGDTMSTLGDIMSTLGVYHDECGDIMSKVGGVQYTGDIMSTQGECSTPEGYHEYTWVGDIMSTLGILVKSHHQISKVLATGSLSASSLRIPDKGNFDASVSFHPQTSSLSKPSLSLGLEISLASVGSDSLSWTPLQTFSHSSKMLETDNLNHSVWTFLELKVKAAQIFIHFATDLLYILKLKTFEQRWNNKFFRVWALAT